MTLYGTAPWANGGRKPNVAPTSPRHSPTSPTRRRSVTRSSASGRSGTSRTSGSRSRTLPGAVREAAAQPRLRRDPSREPARTRRRRRHRAAREHRRLRPACLGARHGEGARQARRLRAQPVRDAPARVALPRSVPVLRRHLDGEPGPRSSRRCTGTSANKQIWLTEYGYQTNPPDQFGVSPSAQAQFVSESALRAYQVPGVTTLIQFLVRDEPDLGRFQSGLFTVRGVAKPAYTRFAFRSRRSRGTARARRSGDRSGRARARARTGSSCAREARGAGRVDAEDERRGLLFDEPRGAARRVIRVWSPQDARLRLAAACRGSYDRAL